MQSPPHICSGSVPSNSPLIGQRACSSYSPQLAPKRPQSLSPGFFPRRSGGTVAVATRDLQARMSCLVSAAGGCGSSH
eukprot:scaffold3038_cov250-Pinguiococcus_pyrenoidosus.AAC.12